MDEKYVCWIGDYQDSPQPIKLVGGKAYNLIELSKLGFNVPIGFIIKTSVYKLVFDGIFGKSLQKKNLINNSNNFDQVRLKLMNYSIPERPLSEISNNLKKIQKQNPSICLRSSNSVEDSRTASFAGQFLSILNLKDQEDIIEGIKKIWASNISINALSYAQYFEINLLESEMAVIIQKFVNADKSGGLFSVNPVSRDHQTLLIEANYGLGVSTADNVSTPDRYIINRNNLDVINKEINRKEIIITSDRKKGVRNIQNDSSKILDQCLTDEEIIRIAKLGLKIEDCFQSPQDIEWAIADKEIFIIQSRSITKM